jgi:hypothetical protein
MEGLRRDAVFVFDSRYISRVPPWRGGTSKEGEHCKDTKMIKLLDAANRGRQAEVDPFILQIRLSRLMSAEVRSGAD